MSDCLERYGFPKTHSLKVLCERHKIEIPSDRCLSSQWVEWVERVLIALASENTRGG